MDALIGGGFVDRHAEARIRTALSDTRIVAIVGPRQSGKTTLARRVAEDDGRPFITLDDDQNRRFARDDPDGFIRGLEYAVIDEIQRVPDMLLALKKQVDEDPRPGRFLITGSVDLFAVSSSPDSLAGRVETITLLPFSQAEIAGTPPPGFLDQAFIGGFATYQNTGPTADLIERVVSGGFPLALARSDPLRRRAWILSYARSLAEREVYDLAKVTKRETPNGADSDLIRPTTQHQSPCRSTRRGRQDCGSLDHPLRADVPCSSSEGMAQQ